MSIFMQITVDASEVSEKHNSDLLIIHSYHEGLVWTDDIQEGISKTLDLDNFEVYIEYMDCYRIFDENTYSNFYSYLQAKYQDKTFDMIMIADNNAYEFMALYYEELFNGIPVVFMGVNNFTEDMIFSNQFTGLAQGGAQEDTIDLIRTIHPNVNRIVLCGSNTATLAAEANYFTTLSENDKYQGITFEVRIDDYIEDQIDRLSTYGSDTVLIVSGIIKNRLDHTIYHDTYASRLIEETKLPVYAMSKIYLKNNGAIGGKVTDGVLHGQIVGSYLTAIAEGKPVEALKIQYQPATSYIFNYERLKEFKINENRINLLGSYEILGKPTRLTILPNNVVYTFIVILGGLILFVVLLSISNKRRQKAEVLVTEQNMELEAFNEELIASSEELNRQYEELASKNQEIEFLAYYDSVTTLMKKERLMEMLEHRLTQSELGLVGMYNIDVVNLNDIVDTFGIEIEDNLLRATANRIMRKYSDVAYLSGVYHDEFILVNTNLMTEQQALNECVEVLNLLTKPIVIDGREIDLKICIGYSILPIISQTANELLIHSDMARMEAERVGMNQIILYHNGFYDSIMKRVRIEKELVKSLKESRFTLYYQPKIDVKTGKISGFEALLRWIKEDGTIISPNDFIPIAEDTGLIIPLGRWVVEKACEQLQIWNDNGLDFSVSVNVSTVQLEDETFEEVIASAITRYNIKHHQLELEITETSVMHNIEQSKILLKRLADLGALISLDDFGSGYSSMTYIKSLPISKIKIDKLFIDECLEKQQFILVKSMIRIGKALNYIVNVEGVEQLEQLIALMSCDIDEVQGYYFSKPLPIDELETYIERYNHSAVQEVLELDHVK